MEAVRDGKAVGNISSSAPGSIRGATRRWPNAVAGAAASAAMTLFYVAVVLGASRSIDHLTDQVGADWYLLLPIVAGFGVQVGLLVEPAADSGCTGAWSPPARPEPAHPRWAWWPVARTTSPTSSRSWERLPQQRSCTTTGSRSCSSGRG